MYYQLIISLIIVIWVWSFVSGKIFLNEA